VPVALFDRIDESKFVPTDHCLGPWTADLLHGGPVGALLAHQLLASATEGEWFPARFTLDLMRPISMAPVEITSTILRAGRRAQLVGAEWRNGGTTAARATLQLIAASEAAVADDNPAKHWARSAKPTPPESAPRAWPYLPTGGNSFQSTSVEHRAREGALRARKGADSDWICVLCDLLLDTPLAPFERVICAADFGNGVSASLPFEEYMFLNADLTVHTFRLPVDEWVLIDAITHMGDRGIGLAESALYDREGLLGRACQSLVVSRR